MNRKRQQAEVLYQLGQLAGPLQAMAENMSAFDREERTRTLARYFPAVPKFLRSFHHFCTSEQGHDYQPEYARAENAFGWFHSAVVMDAEQTKLAENIKALAGRAFEAVYSVPVPVESSIHEAHTPFSTYCLVKDLCSTAKTQLVWMDRYFDQTLFHRYLADTPKTTPITLVTWPESKCTSNKDRQRHTEFMDVSRLFARERGPAVYRLVTDENFHDRWLRCDEKLFSLGGSIKDLGKDSTFTISKLDSTPENIRQFEEPLSRGVEVFGSANTTHP